MSAKSSTSKSESTSQSAPIYVVYGSELFLKRRALDEIIDRVLPDADRAMAMSEFDGGSASVDLAEVLDELRTLPFLSDQRLVYVCDADPFITKNRKHLEDYLDRPSSTGVLLLECRSFPGNTRLAKKAKAIGEVVNCEPIKSWQVSKWVTSHAREAHNLRVDGQAADLLADCIGDNLGRIDGELHKLALYVGDRKRVSREDVQALVGHSREEQVWGILQAISDGKAGHALTLWEDVWQTDRAASARAVGGLAYSVRQVLNGQGRGKTSLDQRELETLLCELLEADVKAKTGEASVQSSIEALILKACRRRKTRRVAS